MELNFKCNCGANHEIKLYDECRYCAKPISIADWANANLTNDDLRSILEQRGLNYPKTITIGVGNGQTQTESQATGNVAVEKRTTKRMRESVVD